MMEFTRESRQPPPTVPTAPVEIRRPPEVPGAEPGNPLARLLPVLMIVAVGGMVVLYVTSGQSTRNPVFMMFPVMMLASALGTLVQLSRGRTTELNAGRRDYLRYLDTVSAVAVETAEVQRVSQQWRHPEPVVLWTLVGGSRMWERRPGDPDFCHIRIGLGAAVLSTPLAGPSDDPVTEPDPVTTDALQALLLARSVVPDVPVTVELTGHIGVVGDSQGAARDLVRAMLCQLAVLHSPVDVRIVALADPDDHTWDWLKWLPHHGEPAPGAAAPARTVVILDRPESSDPAPDRTVLDLSGAGDTVIDGAATSVSDALSTAQAQLCARRSARWRPGTDTGQGGAAEWADLVGIGDLSRFDPSTRWRPRPERDRLRVPIGLSEGDQNQGLPAGVPVALDIKEAAHHGMGPHGLCVGATGSGKSEFLRTLLLGLVATHSPDELNLALIDFKGGATFLGLERLHHVAAVITNLEDETYRVARMHDALSGELNRRQRLLRAAGNLANLADYRRARDRARGAELPALPVLFIVVDEFSELLSQHPDFADLFVAIGRLGRSLGMHLLLASQRLDEGRLRGLETHLSYRVCLKTFSSTESRAVLGVPDAYQLPPSPGAAYLKTASGELVRFRAAFVSGPVRSPAPARPDSAVRLFTAQTRRDQVSDAPPSGVTVLGAVLDRLAGHGSPAHPVWLPPLPAAPPLDELLEAHTGGRLTVPIGLVDNPFAQRHDLLTVDLNDAGGHVAVVGATQSGKSSTLGALMLALAATHGPEDVQFYCLDFGGGTLSSLRALPHTGVVVARGHDELARRTVAQLQALIRRREQAGCRDADGYGEVFLIVDGWATLRQDCDGLDEAITALAAQGLSYGVHVVVAASRWADIRPSLKDQLGTRIELRLGEPAESEMDRKAARHLLDSPPGTGLTREGRVSMSALPRLQGQNAAVAARELRSRYGGPCAIPVQLLPTMVDRREIASSTTSTRVAIGLGESELLSVEVDFGDSGHLTVLGDSGCGKSAALRLLCRELTAGCGPEDVQMYIVDPRRTLLGVVESSHLAGYAMSTGILQTQLPGLADRLRSRLPGELVTQQQLRDRSWWSGPEIYLVVDDYDLVAGATGDPLTPLLEFLPHARDIGLHVVIARRAGGAARALFNPVLSMMRELGGAGLLMSASADDGVLLGSVRSTPLPPGRGTLLARTGSAERVQIAWTDPP